MPPFLVPSERFSLRVAVSDSGSLLGYRVPLMAGDHGIEQTITVMRRLIDQALNDPSFIRFAIDLVRNVPAHDEAGEVAALFGWVQQNIRYTKDPVTKEKLYPPQELLKIRAGDCDDMTTLLGALAIALGYPARAVTVAASPESPNEFSHVYLEVEVPPGSGAWVALDAARPGAFFGRSPEIYSRKRAWSLTDYTYTDLGGCANSRTRIAGLAGYARMHGLGQDDSSIDWGAISSQIISETPQIIAAAQGAPTAARLPSGAMVQTGSPYGSFATPYTPGFALPTAGYGALAATNAVSSSLFSSALPWLLIAVVGFAVIKR